MLTIHSGNTGYHLEFFQYPGGEWDLRDRDGKEILEIKKITATVTNDNHISDDLVKIAFLAKTAETIEINLGYVPAARADRTYDERPAGVNVYASLIDFPNATYRIADPHSSACVNAFKNAKIVEIDIAEIIAELVQLENLADRAYDGLIAPDKGAKHRVEEVNGHLENKLPIYYANKVRDFSSGRIQNYDISTIPGDSNKRYLVVDDICDGGGTFRLLAQQIRERTNNNVSLDLWVTHGIFSGKAPELSKDYENIMTTSTVSPRNEVDALSTTVHIF